ncbi:hypothetical protein D7X38_20855 [Salmonella enterica]|nr:hypothetical protein [Salmonella enterica]
MKIINYIVALSIVFSSSVMSEGGKDIPEWLTVSKQDYNTVRTFFLSGFAAKVFKGETLASSPSDIVNDFESNELAAGKKWDKLNIIYGEIKAVKNIRGEPVVELATPGDKNASFKFVRLKVLDNERESLLSLSKGQEIYATCLGDSFYLYPNFKSCTLKSKELDATLAYGGDYFFPEWDSFDISKPNMKKVLINNDSLKVMNLYGYIMISGVSKDPLLMEKIKSCTPWNAGCYDSFVKILKASSNYLAENAEQLEVYLKDSMKS